MVSAGAANALEDTVLRLWKESETASECRLKLEGEIVDEWADLVARECASARKPGLRIVLDLGGVNYVDRRGLTMLRRLATGAVELVNGAPVLTEQLHGGPDPS
jgi:anti-anti-sigma regulatory factor